MPVFTETAAAVLAGQTVRAHPLMRFDFASSTVRLWTGFDTLDVAGAQWLGAGKIGTVSDLEASIGVSAPQMTFGLSGLDPDFVAAALDASGEIKGRLAYVYLQVFGDDLQPLDNPVAFYVGRMQQLKGDDQGPAGTMTLSLVAETVWARKGLPQWGWLSDRDQKRLFPGDRGLEQIPSLAFKNGGGWPFS